MSLTNALRGVLTLPAAGADTASVLNAATWAAAAPPFISITKPLDW